MTDSLTGTVALVTGASSGIGAATAEALANQGAAVALLARRRDRLDELAARIRADGGTAEVIEADLADREQATDAVADTVTRLGRLDTVVNNAGVMLLGPFDSAPTEEWERMLAVNLTGLLYVARAAMPHLDKAAADEPRQVADLVNVSSLAGRKSFAAGGVYNATKFGVAAFSEALRQEAAGRHVRVSVIEPGNVATELASHNRPAVRDMLAGGQFAGIEPLRAEDVADSIVHIVTRPRHVAINEILIRPAEQVF